MLYKWEYNDYFINCYGWYEGEKCFENKHILPPCGNSDFLDLESSENKLYGDIFIIKKQKTKFLSLDISEYGEFYNYNFELYNEEYNSNNIEENDDIQEENNNIGDQNINDEDNNSDHSDHDDNNDHSDHSDNSDDDDDNGNDDIISIIKTNKNTKTDEKELELEEDLNDYK